MRLLALTCSIMTVLVMREALLTTAERERDTIIPRLKAKLRGQSHDTQAISELGTQLTARWHGSMWTRRSGQLH
jgi:hypothetical protein